ncbi:MAG: hypothetical protein ACLR4Z_13815 [Butyricicoccaceae bacterium]
MLWKSHGDFQSSHEASVFLPHATKAILEDGLLATSRTAPRPASSITSQPAVSRIKQGEWDVVLTFANGEDCYSARFPRHLNGDWRELWRGVLQH